MIKNQTMRERVKRGNYDAQQVIDYINYRLNKKYTPCDIQSDMIDKTDYYNPENGKTAQVKIREQRSDFIFESHKFLFDEYYPSKKTNFRQLLGRDALSMANIYICKPKQYNPEKIHFAHAAEIKKINENLHAEWQDGDKINNEMIYHSWRRSELNNNKQCLMYHGKNGAEIVFKIDEGSDRKPYGKFLTFIPPETLSSCLTLKTRDGEEISRRDTWYSAEKISG
jgi:hypothetical protein